MRGQPIAAIRRASPDDWPHISPLLSASALPLEGAREHLGEFVVAERDGTIVGCAAVERYGVAGLLRSVAVAPTERGNGTGAALVNRCLAEAVRGGLSTLTLLTTTAADYFHRFGFAAVDPASVPDAVRASEEFRGACPASAIVMMATLFRSSLVYVFWHWKKPSIDRVEYETSQRGFHAALAAHPPEGFSHSTSSMVTGAPWANGGGPAYEDRYFLRDAAALDALEGAVANGRRQQAHDQAARGAAAGTAGLYHVRLGAPPAAPHHASWFSRADEMSYDQLFALLAPLVKDHESALWMRRMVLGPPAEFCLQSAAPLEVPLPLRPLRLALQPLWPAG